MTRLSSWKNSLAIFLFCAVAVIASSAQTFNTLVNFDGTNGSHPTSDSPLVQGTDGNLYGITYFGGTPTSCLYSAGTGCGTLFKVTPAGEFTTLYSFCSRPNCADGANPLSLIQASDGNFYGVTYFGGVSRSVCYGYGCGTVFKFTPGGQLTTIYTFCLQSGCPDGVEPEWLIQATNGNFYGVTLSDGAHRDGTVFELTSAGVLTTLYSFCVQTGCPDGSSPVTLMQASNRNFYGSSYFGGTYNAGTIFQITRAGKLTTLANVRKPNAIIQGGDGSLYGTTAAGGGYDHGVVFQLTPAGKVIALHSFCAENCATGDSPLSGVAEGSDGNFYGTTYYAGITYYAGSVYELTPTGTFTTLYLFCSLTNCADGDGGGAMMQATNGDFYGTTVGTGTVGSGTVFSLSLGLGPFVAARPGFGSAGQVVTILGNNLTGSTSVTFNGTPAKFRVISDTYIQTQVPTGATTGSIRVTTPGGALNSNIAFQVVP